MKENDEPAFPVDTLDQGMTMGMTLRDYFAGQALAGVLGSCILANYESIKPRAIVTDAYCIADAMLEERKK